MYKKTELKLSLLVCLRILYYVGEFAFKTLHLDFLCEKFDSTPFLYTI